MAMSKLVPLRIWAHDLYGEHAPFIGTLRRWARDGKIYPSPKKHGRSYFVEPDARYVDDHGDSDFLEKVRVATQAHSRR
jgi:hypothetical protein